MSDPRVPFSDLGRAHARIRAELDEAIARVVGSGWYVGGPEVEGFERDFARFAAARFCVGVANGTDAIALALRAAGIAPGDEVLVPGVSAYPTVVGVLQAGAVPAFVDVTEAGTLDPAELAAMVGPRTRAVVPVHLYGVPCDMRAIHALARERSLRVVEDCAQAHGAAWEGVAVGTGSAAASWSFYPTKNLGALGDAGAVSTDDEATATTLRSMRNYGQRNRYEHVTWGVNSRLDPLQAAVLRVKLARLADDNARRRAIAARYDEALGQLTSVRPLPIPAGATPSRHLYPVVVRDAASRERFRAAMTERGVETLIHYPIPLADQKASDPAWRRASLARSEALCAAVVSLPIYPELADDAVERVIDATRAAAEALG